MPCLEDSALVPTSKLAQELGDKGDITRLKVKSKKPVPRTNEMLRVWIPSAMVAHVYPSLVQTFKKQVKAKYEAHETRRNAKRKVQPSISSDEDLSKPSRLVFEALLKQKISW